MANKKYINFLEFQDTALNVGDYFLEMTQTLQVEGVTKIDRTFSQKMTVTGNDRFKLSPDQIFTFYPNSGSRGSYQTVLPHIVLNQSNLPWERDTGIGNAARLGNPSWLALIVFHDEPDNPAPHPTTIDIATYNGLIDDTQSNIHIPNSVAKLELGEQLSDPVTVIDVDRALYQAIAPSKDDLAYLAHVRREVDIDEAQRTTFKRDQSNEAQIKSERSIILANRLPKPGCRNVIHLVSLEKAYNTDGTLKSGGEKVRLVSLKSWSFFCEPTGPNFVEILKNLDGGQLTRETSSGNNDIKAYFEAGFTVLPHQLRKGQRTLSLYRGPLTPGHRANPTLANSFPIDSADKLLVYDRKSGMLDVSYAVAWTLGRQMALQDQDFALLLYNHKQKAAIKALQDQEQAGKISDLPLNNNPSLTVDADSTARADKIKDWLHQHRFLQTIPFQYLLPSSPDKAGSPEKQTNYLPKESIRFFKIDPFWLNCFQDGALSLGTIPGTNSNARIVTPRPIEHMSGFLIRSRVIKDFPEFQIKGYETAINDNSTHFEAEKTPFQVFRMSEEVLLCLFQHDNATTQIEAVDFFLEPNTSVTFGFKNSGSGDTPVFEKDLRDITGLELKPSGSTDPSDRFFYTLTGAEINSGAKVINFKNLADKLKENLTSDASNISGAGKTEFGVFTSADLALQLMEGSPRVRFTASDAV